MDPHSHTPHDWLTEPIDAMPTHPADLDYSTPIHDQLTVERQARHPKPAPVRRPTAWWWRARPAVA